MKTINKTISIGTGNMELHVNASIDGKEVLNKKSDSLIGQFAKMLYGCMQPQAMSFNAYLNSVAITNVTSQDGLIKITVSSSTNLATGNHVHITRVTGTTEANGDWTITAYTTNQWTLDGSTFTNTYIGGGIGSFYGVSQSNTLYNGSLKNAGMLVGIGSTTPTISDVVMDQQILDGSSTGKLVYNAYTTSQDTNDSTSAQVTTTQTFTNNSGSSVVVNEIGLLMNYYYNYPNTWSILVARDVVAGGITVATGKTLTINYRIKTILAVTGDTGGFIASFMRLMYSQIAATTRSLYDITNTSITISNSVVNLLVTSAGGPGVTTRYLSTNTLKSENLGIQVGSGNSAVAMGDYALGTKITHGKSTGQLLYHGTFLDDYTESNPDATFTISRIFENASGGNVTVKEIGIYAGAAGQNIAVIDVPAYSACIIHNLLATPITLSDGDVMKVIYTLKVTV